MGQKFSVKAPCDKTQARLLSGLPSHLSHQNLPRGWETARSAKCSLGKHKELSSDPSTHIKYPDVITQGQ